MYTVRAFSLNLGVIFEDITGCELVHKGRAQKKNEIMWKKFPNGGGGGGGMTQTHFLMLIRHKGSKVCTLVKTVMHNLPR